MNYYQRKFDISCTIYPQIRGVLVGGGKSLRLNCDVGGHIRAAVRTALAWPVQSLLSFTAA